MYTKASLGKVATCDLDSYPPGKGTTPAIHGLLLARVIQLAIAILVQVFAIVFQVVSELLWY